MVRCKQILEKVTQDLIKLDLKAELKQSTSEDICTMFEESNGYYIQVGSKFVDYRIILLYELDELDEDGGDGQPELDDDKFSFIFCINAEKYLGDETKDLDSQLANLNYCIFSKNLNDVFKKYSKNVIKILKQYNPIELRMVISIQNKCWNFSIDDD